MRVILASLIFLVLIHPASGQSSQAIQSLVTPPVAMPLMPMPSKLQVGTGELRVTPAFSVGLEGYKGAPLDRAVERFLGNVTRRTGLFIGADAAAADKSTLVIYTEHAGSAVQELGEDESYSLNVTAAGAKLSAANPLGILRGLQTFLQLIQVTPAGLVVNAVQIEDAPRFPWRGLMIDVSRHFIQMDTLKRNVDAMEAVKLNVLHLHLSDDQGFRLQNKEFPKLTESGSDGQFYTQAEMRELVEYAGERGIRVVPEFDMPGHSTAWFVGYPEVSSGPGPYAIERRWGIFDPAMDPTREETYKFLDKFIGEMAAFFPDHYFHIGGDEVNGKQWDANPKIQEFKREHKLKSNEELQAYFTQRVEKLVRKHHKTMVGWDEILVPGMPEEIVIQSWRGQDSLAKAAQQGYRGLLSSGYYLDAMAPAGKYYAVDPMSNADAALTPEQQKRILGGEAAAWAEFISDENNESRIWPRAAAIAERLWSPQDMRDPESMYARLAGVNQELEQLGLRQRSNMQVMLGRMAGNGDISALRILAEVVEPVSITIREKEAQSAGGIQTSDIALNRLVDAVEPESETARRFSLAVNQFVSSNFQDAQAETHIRSSLIAWRDNDAALQPVLQASYLLQEAVPVSKNLNALAVSGLQALDYADKKQVAPESWRTQQTALVQRAAKPTADLNLAIAPAIQKLIDADAGAN
jgi:hexosaminidase